jgi:hypothetical protein
VYSRSDQNRSMSDPTLVHPTTSIMFWVIVIVALPLIWRIYEAEVERLAKNARKERKSSSFTCETRGYQLDDSRYNHNNLKSMRSIRESAEAGYHVPNNHDHLKYMHSSQKEAEAEVHRMKRTGFEGSERLNAYHNSGHGGWYVGKSW